MKIQKLLIIAISFITLSVQAAWEVPPTFTKLPDQIDYLLAIREEIPSLIENGAEYDVDPFQIFAIQNAFVAQLQLQPGFQSAARSREYLHTIRARYVRSQTINAFVMNPEVVKRAIDESRSSSKITFRDLERAISTWARHDGRGILTGLAMLQPDNVKKEVFRSANVGQKISILRANKVSEETIKKGFRFAEHNLTPSEGDYKSLVSIVEDQFEAEVVIWNAIMASFTRDSTTKLETLTALDVVQRLEELGAEAEHLDGMISEFRTAIESRYFTKKKMLVDIPEEELTLREVPGSLAVFRGIVGSDCATQYSCPIAILPAEHTFFIYDGAGVLRGYLSGTRLHVQDEQGGKSSAFYLHDFAGPKLSARTAKLALAALAKEIPAMGMKKLVVPVAERQEANMNYKIISDAISSVMDEAYLTNIYDDKALRYELMQTAFNVDWSYDQPESNVNSHEILTSELRMDELQSEVTKSKAREIDVSSKGLSHREAMLLVMDLLSPEAMPSAVEALKAAIAEVKAAGYQVNGATFDARTQAAQRISQQYRLDINLIYVGIRALQNPNADMLQTYYQNAEETLRGLGIALDAKLVDSHPHFFYEGHIAAPDAATVEDKKLVARTVDYTIAILRRWPASNSAWDTILGSPEIFGKSGKFQNYLRTLLIAPEAQLEAFTRLNSVGFDFSFLNNDRDMESLEARRASAKSTNIKSTLKKIIGRFCETKVAKSS